MKVVCDLEADDLKATKIWCIVCKEVESGKVSKFTYPNLSDFIDFSRGVDTWIGHNFISYDGPTLNRLLQLDIDLYNNVMDTLVVSRLLNYNQTGGHSLASWGERLGLEKIDFNDWSHFSPEMLTYCERDVEVNYKLYKRFEPYLKHREWQPAIELEHYIASLTNDLTQAGFSYNITNSNTYRNTISEKLLGIKNTFSNTFPKRSKPLKVITPKVTQKGTLNASDFRFLGPLPDLSPYNVDCPFTRFDWVEFNPSSQKQCIERLWEFGWKPTAKTDGHIDAIKAKDEEKLRHFAIYGWKIDEENLNTLPDDAPEAARTLKEWVLYSSRYRTLRDWEALVQPSERLLEGQRLGVIHGTFNHIGSWTHRMSHSDPNMANIPAELGRDGKVAPYGKEFRSLWCTDDDHVLVGVDADQIQLRVLAHYLEDERFTAALVSGDKDKGTDVHTLNAKALGPICRGRGVAKTFIYSWLLGAGVAKTAEVLGCTTLEAKRARDNFIAYYPGLKRLKRYVIPEDAARGYFVGFDGRKVIVEDEYHVLAGYLQNGESVIMKTATRLWREKLREMGLADSYRLINFVHDEWVTETRREVAQEVGRVQQESIRQASDYLGLNCPMTGGAVKIGMNWYEIH